MASILEGDIILNRSHLSAGPKTGLVEKQWVWRGLNCDRFSRGWVWKDRANLIPGNRLGVSALGLDRSPLPGAHVFRGRAPTRPFWIRVEIEWIKTG